MTDLVRSIYFGLLHLFTVRLSVIWGSARCWRHQIHHYWWIFLHEFYNFLPFLGCIHFWIVWIEDGLSHWRIFITWSFSIIDIELATILYQNWGWRLTICRGFLLVFSRQHLLILCYILLNLSDIGNNLIWLININEWVSQATRTPILILNNHFGVGYACHVKILW